MKTNNNVHVRIRWGRLAILFAIAIIISFAIGITAGLLLHNLKNVGEENSLSPAVLKKEASISSEPIETAIALTPLKNGIEQDTVKTVEEYQKLDYFDVPLSDELQEYIVTMCEEYDVPFELVLAIIEVESSFDENAVSDTDDYGLMQINSINYDSLSSKLGITDLLDPYQNIQAGTYIIGKHLAATDGDIALALMRYNCGATGARRLWEQGIYSTSYTDKVMAAYEAYKKESSL